MARRSSRQRKAEELSEFEKVYAEAKDRFTRCETWESHARTLADDDDKFVNGDSDNGFQWPDRIKTQREIDAMPCLTINKVRQHCLMIENDAKQNKPGIIVHPTSDEASYEAAQCFEDIIRHIEGRSHAANAYDIATVAQVRTGYGVLRVITDYCDPETFDQEIYIRGVRDPRTVYFDPDAQEIDKSDGRFAFVFDDMDKADFEEKYPGVDAGVSGAGMDFGGWLTENHVRVAEYWRKTVRQDTLASWIDPQSGERINARKSKSGALWPEFIDAKDQTVKTRDVEENVIECFTIAGNKVIKKDAWLGEYIPLVPVIGEEVVVDGKMDRRGHVRMMKDPQRMYNYYSSAAVQSVALQSKTPYIGEAAAFEGYESDWAAANRENLAYLAYNGVGEGGRSIPPPQRQPGPEMPDAMLRGMEVAQNEMMMVSGQFQAQMGENENAKSGKAIAERQRQGDTATYHFIDNQAIAIRHLGRILIDLIPKIYDTKRVLRVRGQDGTQRTVIIDPGQQAAIQQQEQKGEQSARLIFNPNVGKYDVEADIGPSYATRREEAWNAIVQIISTNKEMAGMIGDILFRNADFPGADEIAERLKKMLPPQLMMNDNSSPQMQAMQQQFQAQTQKMQSLIGELMQKLAEERLKLKAKDAQKEIDIFEAETNRLRAVADVQTKMATSRELVQQTTDELLGFNLDDAQNAMGQELKGGTDKGTPAMAQQ